MDGRYTAYCIDLARRVQSEDGTPSGAHSEGRGGEAYGHCRCRSCGIYTSQAFTVKIKGTKGRLCWKCAQY